MKSTDPATTLVLLNPHAQGGRAVCWREPIRQWLFEHSPDTPLVVSTTIEQACTVIQDLPPGSRVVAVGGDGTINRWLPAILQGQHELGLVPMGSGNDVARALGVFDWPWQEALRFALTSTASPMDVGVAQHDDQSFPFLSSLTAGFDSAVCRRALLGPKWLRGLPRYVWATLAEVVRVQNWQVRVDIDGQRVKEGRALLVCTLNTPTLGSGMPAAIGAQIDDGQLDVLEAGQFGFWATLNILPKLLLGTHTRHPRITMHRMQSMTIESEHPIPLASDGEYRGETLRLCVQLAVHRLPVVRRAN